MANVMRILHDNIGARAYPVKGSIAEIEVGDFVFFNNIYQGLSNQQTIQPASSGSVGATAANSRFQFANLFVGVSHQRHAASSYDKNLLLSVDADVEAIICNTTGVETTASADAATGTKVGIACDASRVPLDDKIVLDGINSVTVADNEAIGFVARQVKSGDKTARVHIKGLHVFSQTGI